MYLLPFFGEKKNHPKFIPQQTDSISRLKTTGVFLQIIHSQDIISLTSENASGVISVTISTSQCKQYSYCIHLPFQKERDNSAKQKTFSLQLQRDRLENIHHPLFFIQGPMTSPPRSVSLSPSLLNRQELCFTVCLISHMCSVTQLWPILCDPMDYSSPGSSVHEIFQARILKWVAISFSRNITYIKGRLKKKRITTTS